MFLILALLAADPAPAVQTAPAAASAPAPSAAATDPLQRKVCWRDQATGSIMPAKRICMTVAERRAWVAQMQGNVNAALDRRQRASVAGTPD